MVSISDLKNYSRKDYVGFFIGFLIGSYWFLTHETFSGALLGLFAFSSIGYFIGLSVVEYRNRRRSMIFYFILVIGLSALIFLLVAQGSLGDFITVGGVAKNPITGECSYDESMDHPRFPWYYNEGGCDINKICSEPVQNEKLCSKIENSGQNSACASAVEGQKAAMNTSETLDIPSICFMSGYSLADQFPNAEPGDRMRKNDTGLVLVE